MFASPRHPQDFRLFLAAPSPGIADARLHAGRVARLAEQAAAGMLARADKLVPALGRSNNFSPAEAARAFRLALEGIRAERLMALWEKEAAGAEGPGLTVVFAGGVIPQPAIRAAVAAAMVSERVIVRPSAGDPWLVERFMNEMIVLDECLPEAGRAGLRKRLMGGTWWRDEAALTREIIENADAVVVYGDGTTIPALRAMGGEGTRWFIHGPRVSVAILDARGIDQAQLNLAADGLADDVMACNQLGCLSPSTLIIAGASAEGAKRFRTRLGEAIAGRIQDQGCAPAMPLAAALEIQSLRAVYSMGPGCEVVGSHGLPGWTLLSEGDSVRERLLWQPTPGFQTLFIRGAASVEAAIQDLESEANGRIQSTGIAPDAEGLTDALRGKLSAMGVSRVCSFGGMQNPPLEWLHDGNPFFPARTG